MDTKKRQPRSKMKTDISDVPNEAARLKGEYMENNPGEAPFTISFILQAIRNVRDN